MILGWWLHRKRLQNGQRASVLGIVAALVVDLAAALAVLAGVVVFPYYATYADPPVSDGLTLAVMGVGIVLFGACVSLALTTTFRAMSRR